MPKREGPATTGCGEWLRGYAAGMAAVHRVTHSDSGVMHALRADGITIKKLREAGVESFDLSVLRKCMPRGER